MDSIQQQFEGYLQTPYLWFGEGPLHLKQFELPPLPTIQFDQLIGQNLRLGKLVERFVSQELSQHENIQILEENIQIQKEKLTLGELDCLLLQDENPIHLEVIYKFYLYAPKVGETSLSHWIGPNRRDSLVLKLNKLKERQLPLLYHKQTFDILNKHGLNAANIEQRVCFKAQLFVPADETAIDYQQLNPNCTAGKYLYFDALIRYENCKFYIPRKHDWLVRPHAQKPWLSFLDAREILEGFMLQESAPLVWVKHPNGLIEKLFVCWWR